MKKQLLAILSGCMLLASCGDDEEEKKTEPQPSKIGLITGKNWDMDQMSATKNGVNYPGYNDNNAASCSKDDLLILKTDLTYVNDEGATKCSPSSPQTQQSGTWQFANNESQITFKTGAVSETQTIDKLTATEMVLSREETRSDGTYRFTDHYTAK